VLGTTIVFAMVVRVAAIRLIKLSASGVLAVVCLEWLLGSPALTTLAAMWLRAEVLFAITHLSTTTRFV
jgi:hypothetical protein